MPKEKPELSDAMRAKLSRKAPIKNPIKGTRFTIAISSAKVVLENLHLQLI